jgi:hypothetical protein
MSTGKGGESDKIWQVGQWAKKMNKDLTSKISYDNQKPYGVVSYNYHLIR